MEYNHDLPVLPPVQLDEVSKTIGGLIAERIPDGACCQSVKGSVMSHHKFSDAILRDVAIHCLRKHGQYAIWRISVTNKKTGFYATASFAHTVVETFKSIQRNYTLSMSFIKI